MAANAAACPQRPGNGTRARAAAGLLLAALSGGAGPEPPDTSAVWSRLAQDRVGQALHLARDLVSRSPDEPDAVSALGATLLRAGLPEEAEARLSRVGESRLGPRGLVTLARLRAASGRADEARRLADRALAAAGDDAEVVYWAAPLAGSNAEARQRYERYLTLLGPDESPDRVEAARGGLRILEALGERPVWVVRRRPAEAVLPLAPLPGRAGRARGYVLEVRTGGSRRPLRLLFDTGSPGVFLTARAARKRGLVALADETAFGGGGSGRLATTRGLLPRFSVGELRFEDALVTVTAGPAERSGRYHGVIGLAPFAGYRVTIDLSRSRLRLARPETSAAAPLGGERLWVFAGQWLLRARLAAAGEDAAGLFLLDTGAAETLLAHRFLGRLDGVRTAGHARVRGFAGQLRAAGRVRGVELRALDRTRGGEFLAADLDTRSRMGGVEVAGFLGLDLLDGKTIVVDTARHRVSLVDEHPRRPAPTGRRTAGSEPSGRSRR